MRVDLVARTQRSRLREILAPVAAMAVAIVVGGIVVALMGRSPLTAFDVYFVQPLTQSYSLQAIAVKATPLVLIGVGLAFCYRANLWNIGAEGQFIAGGALGGWLGLLTHDGAGQAIFGSWWILPAMMVLGDRRRRALRADPGVAEGQAARLGNPHQPDAGLCRATRRSIGWCADRGRTRRATTCRSRSSSIPKRRCRRSSTAARCISASCSRRSSSPSPRSSFPRPCSATRCGSPARRRARRASAASTTVASPSPPS